MSQNELTPRCYCCGERLELVFVLIAFEAATDRVFVMKPEHIDRLDKAMPVHLMTVTQGDCDHDPPGGEA